MSVASKNEVTQEERGIPPPQRKGKRKTCMRHCKRFWWIYLIAFCCMVVLVVCLVIFVGVPNIAQDKVNESKLELNSVSLTDSTSDSYDLNIDSTITTDGSLGANIDAFEGVMYLEDIPSHKPFATIDFPKTTGAKSQDVTVSQHTKITDMDAFTTFATWFNNNKTVTITVKGKTKVQPDGLDRKYGVNYKKSVTVNALNLFKGTKVTNASVSVKPNVDYNFHGVAEIPNPSVFTLEFGNVSFNNFVKDEKQVGTLHIDDFTLKPGTNKMDIKGNMDQLAMFSIVSKRPYCEDGIVPIILQGSNVTNHGQNLTYFAAALASANQTLDLDVGTIIKQSLGGDITCSD